MELGHSWHEALYKIPRLRARRMIAASARVRARRSLENRLMMFGDKNIIDEYMNALESKRDV